jgi:hypothetical protein
VRVQLKLNENRHLVSPPKEIVAMGSAHVLRFLSKLYQGHERLYRMKLMFVLLHLRFRRRRRQRGRGMRHD